MNLAESMKYVLRHKSQDIFIHLWKEDFRPIFLDLFHEVVTLKNKQHRKWKMSHLKATALEAKDTLTETAFIFKVLPSRMNEAFKESKVHFLKELELLPDSKSKTIFSMRVVSGLGRFALASAYSIKKDMPFLGIGKRRNAYTHLIMTRLIFRISRLFLIRFIDEVQSHIESGEDFHSLQSFKDIMLAADGDGIEKYLENIQGPDDKANELVEAFKQKILRDENDRNK